MKLTLLTLTTIVTLSAAQNLSGEPPCATACLSSAISKAGCAESDQACQCGPTQASIGAIVATCLLASCPATELGAVQSIGLALCAQYSAGLTMTTTTAPAATVTSTVGSSSNSLSTSNGPVATSTSTTVATNSTVVSTTSAATMASSGASSASSASSAASSASAKSSGSATTSAPSTVSSSAARALLANGIGGLAALFFGVVATL